MNVKTLIKTFSSRETLPIDVQDDIVPVLRKDNPLQDLYFWPEDLDVGILKGQISYWQWPDNNGQKTDVVDIGFSKHMSTDWQRVVCCKELIHILDPVDCRVMTDEEFDRLCEKIVLPPELQDQLDGVQVWTDRVAVYQAVAILFPWASRQLLKAPYDEGKVTADEIAKQVDIPVRYVKLVMSRGWEKLHHILTDG